MKSNEYEKICNPAELFDKICSNEVDLFEYLHWKWSNHDNYPGLYAEKHPLGFIKIELTPIIGSQSVSVHLWFTKEKTQIHNHHFDMKSKVIIGELEDTQFNLKEKETGDYVLYDVIYDSDNQKREFIRSKKQYKLIPYKPTRVSNSIYFIENGVMHRTCSTCDFSISVVLRFNINESYSTVALQAQQKSLTLCDEKVISISRVLRLIENLRNK